MCVNLSAQNLLKSGAVKGLTVLGFERPASHTHYVTSQGEVMGFRICGDQREWGGGRGGGVQDEK